MKYLIDQQGNYIGGFGGDLPEGKYIEIAQPPEDVRMIWNFKEEIFVEKLETIRAKKLQELDSYYYNSPEIRVLTIKNLDKYYKISLTDKGRNLLSEQVTLLDNKIEAYDFSLKFLKNQNITII